MCCAYSETCGHFLAATTVDLLHRWCGQQWEHVTVCFKFQFHAGHRTPPSSRHLYTTIISSTPLSSPQHHYRLLYTTIDSSTLLSSLSSPLHHHRLLYTTIISSTPPSSPLHYYHHYRLLYTTIDSSTSQSSLVEPKTTPEGLPVA
jgi:hypothetical protein